MTDFFARVIAGMIPFRAVRRKVRHSLMQRTIEKRLDVVMERMTSLAAQIQANQIMLASSCKDKYLTIANRTSSAQLCLHTTDSGKLCLTPPDPEKSQWPSVMVMTLPKSGTHFVSKILDNIGYQYSRFNVSSKFSDEYDYISDFRPIAADNAESQFQFLRQGGGQEIPMPLSIALSFLQPGQYTKGHLFDTLNYDSSQLRSIRKIHMIRDLRIVLISWMRWNRKLSPHVYSSLKSEEECMLSFLDGSKKTPLRAAQSSVIWLNNPEIPTLRYEDLCSTDPEKRIACTRVIADVSDCEFSLVASAIERAIGAPTVTKMDTPSRLEGYWTKKVEEVFLAMGFGDLNEQLGYTEKWCCT